MTVFPAVLTFKVVMVGGVRSLILRVLVAVALLSVVIVPEFSRFTVPPALLVIPATVPVPLRLRVPVFVKFAKAVEIGPAPVLVIVPALARVLMETLPPMLSVPPALFVSEPVPVRLIPIVRIPLFVRVPSMLTLAMDVFVVPLMVLPVLPNECVELSDVTNAVALFVRSSKKS